MALAFPGAAALAGGGVPLAGVAYTARSMIARPRRARRRPAPAAERSVGGPGGAAPLRGWRRWAFPLLTATLIPALLFVALEVGLRVAGYGYPASFFVPLDGRPGVLTTNQRFGWRFFPPAVAREPVVCELPARKADGAVRVFVLGGSAAMGTPAPGFGLARVLETMFEETWPGTRFEVVNAAMAAINSHAVRVIAGDCARRRPDLFVVYLGNNEVVGPYGPGSVFGRFSPGLAFTRAAIAARGTRTGQLLARPADWLGGRGGEEVRRWRGMELFTGRLLAADDLRLEQTYHHLRRNLRAVLDLAREAGAAAVVSTVAVDLADSPPFASLHRPGLADADRERWEAAVERASARQTAGDLEAALAAYREALAIDDRHAELHYRTGRALLALGRTDEARDHLEQARHLDALRFRADREINSVIREVTADASHAGAAVDLVDAERDLAGAGAVPGGELFYEHVHLRFEGTHRLARLIFERAAPRLAARLGPPAGEPPAAERCAEQLALTALDRLAMAEAILRMTARPPFTGQLDHARRHDRRRAEVRALRARAAGRREEAIAAKRKELERRPDDLALRQDLAGLLADAGRPAEAAAEWRRLVERIPGVVAWHTRFGFALADAGHLAEAEVELRRALALTPGAPDARANLGTVLERGGDLDGAEAFYRRALADDPAAEAARLNLARLLERRGRFDDAVAEYRAALGADPDSAAAHRRLAEAYDRRGRLEEAAAEYRAALALDPDLAAVHNNLGHALERLGRAEQAAAAYAAAVEADPGYALAWFNLADLLLAHGRAAEAAAAYRRALALDLDNPQGRANLALALRLAGEPPALADDTVNNEGGE